MLVVLILKMLLLIKVPALVTALATQLNVPLLINFPVIKTPFVVFNVHEADDFKTNTDEEIPPLVHVSELLTNIESVPAIVPARSRLLNEYLVHVLKFTVPAAPTLRFLPLLPIVRPEGKLVVPPEPLKFPIFVNVMPALKFALPKITLVFPVIL